MLVALGAAPLVAGVVLCLGAPSVLRYATPALAARSLVALGLCTALSTGVVLCAVACLGITELPGFARLGDWSARSLTLQAPVPEAAAFGASAVALGLVAASVFQLTRTVRRLRAASAGAHALGPALHGLSVLDTDAVTAYAIPSLPRRPGRTVVSTATLRLLDPDERRALLAHEASHVRHHHALLVQLAELCAAANPLLRPAVTTVRAAVEQWADAEARDTVGDPTPVARALAKLALARAHSAAPRPDLALEMAARTELAGRIHALGSPRASSSRVLVACALALALACTAGGSGVGVDAYSAFQRAEARFAQLHR